MSSFSVEDSTMCSSAPWGANTWLAVSLVRLRYVIGRLARQITPLTSVVIICGAWVPAVGDVGGGVVFDSLRLGRVCGWEMSTSSSVRPMKVREERVRLVESGGWKGLRRRVRVGLLSGPFPHAGHAVVLVRGVSPLALAYVALLFVGGLRRRLLKSPLMAALMSE